MNKCKFCGNELKPEDAFCTKCGRPIMAENLSKKSIEVTKRASIDPSFKDNAGKWNSIIKVQILFIVCLFILIAASFVLFKPKPLDKNTKLTVEKDTVEEKNSEYEPDDSSESSLSDEEKREPEAEAGTSSGEEEDYLNAVPVEPDDNEPAPSLKSVDNSPAEERSDTVTTTSPIEWHDQNLKNAVLQQITIGDGMTPADARNIQSLTLDDQGIRDIQDLRWFTNLRELSLKGNYISDISSLAGMTNLEKLNLEINAVENIGPLSGLTNLRRLDLYSNRIVDISPLSDMTGLRMLDIRQNYVEDISVLYRMTEMEELYMSSNRITDIWPVDGMNRLRYLSVKENPVEDISYLHGKNNLDTLVIASTNVEEISVVENLPALAYLDVRGCDITDRTVISRLKKRGGIKIEQ